MSTTARGILASTTQNNVGGAGGVSMKAATRTRQPLRKDSGDDHSYTAAYASLSDELLRDSGLIVLRGPVRRDSRLHDDQAQHRVRRRDPAYLPVWCSILLERLTFSGYRRAFLLNTLTNSRPGRGRIRTRPGRSAVSN